MDSQTVSRQLSVTLNKPRIYTDLNGGWRVGDNYVVPLNSIGTQTDLQVLGHVLTPGLALDFWTDDGDDKGNSDPLLFEGVVQFDEDAQKWVAVAAWNGFHHASELKKTALAPEAALVG